MTTAATPEEEGAGGAQSGVRADGGGPASDDRGASAGGIAQLIGHLLGDVDLRLAWAVCMRNATVYRRTWLRSVLPNFFEPVLYLVGFGFGLGAYMRGGLEGTSYVAFVGPGLVAASAMNGASFETTYNMFIKMSFSKLYDAYLTTPASIRDIAFGELLWAVVRALIYGVAFFVILVAFTAAGHPVITSPWAVLVPLAIALTGAVFALLGQLFTSSVTVIDLYSYYFTLFLTPLFLFSGIFFPPEDFPLGGEIAWCTPLYHAVRLTRALCRGAGAPEALVSAAWLIALACVLGWIVPRRLGRRYS